MNNIIKKENPYWSKKLREKEKRQREEKKKFLEIKKIEKKKQKEIDRLSKLSSQNRVNKRCICCNEIKILNDFQKLKRYRASYCKNCYKLILLNSPKISVKCSSCKKNKSLSELYGTKPIKAFQRRTCIICEMRNRKIWRINNIEKVLKAKRRYNLRKNELVSNKKSLW